MLMAVAVLLAACERQPKTVDGRAQARWDALLAEDYEQAYTYLSPGYRSSVSLDDYQIGLKSRRIKWIEAAYKSQECPDETSCVVTMDVGYHVVSPMRNVNEWQSNREVKEQWVKIDQNWWLVPTR